MPIESDKIVDHEVTEYNKRSLIYRKCIAQKVFGRIIAVSGWIVLLVSLFSSTAAFLPLAIVGSILFICGACLYFKSKFGFAKLEVETLAKCLNSKRELGLKNFELPLQKRNEIQPTDPAYLNLATPQMTNHGRPKVEMRSPPQ